MLNWKKAITEGNASFQSKHYTLAISQYGKASHIARSQVHQWFDTEASLAALLVTDFNLAESFCRTCQFNEAIAIYINLYHFLINFQQGFQVDNPIASHVSLSLIRLKREFLSLTKTYPDDISIHSYPVSEVDQKHSQLTHINFLQ